MTSPSSNTILAKERGAAPTGNQIRRGAAITFYDVCRTPKTPIHVGQKIHIHALLSCTALFQGGEGAPTRYTAFDTGIGGTVLGIRAIEGSVVEFVVRNEEEWSRTEYAYLSVPFIQGRTTNISLWDRVLRAASTTLAY